MSEPDIRSLVAAGETARLEFKRSLSDAKKIVETAAAMATIAGGTILVGIRDDGAVLGATEGKGELERLVQQILAGTDPKLYVDIVGKPFASSSYARIAKASLRTAGTDLLALERLGLVKRVGRGKATRWMRI